MGKEHKEYTWNLIAKKLAGEATAEELRELEALLRNNPELHYPVQTISDLWEHSSPANHQVAEDAFNRHLDRIEYLNIPYTNRSAATLKYFGKKSGLFRRLAFTVVPAVVLIAGLWVFTRPAHSEIVPPITPKLANTAKEIVTKTGSRTRLSLPDGTHVWVNAGSRIHYDKAFGETLREVSLTGEAFFDVAPDAAHPFIIHTKSMDIRVLGTSFNIKSYPTDKTTEATLIRGSIEVSIRNRPSEKIILKPNEKLVISNEDSIMEKRVHRKNLRPESLVVVSKPTYETHTGVIIETSWVNNKLIFQDEEFSDLARQMERWYGVSIHFEDASQEELRFTGIFEKESIRQALDALKLTARFDYTIEGTQVTIQN